MTASELRAELEAELSWRQSELAFFKNQLCNIIDENNQDRYRKSLILMLYSHLEGYIKIALLTYIRFINSQTLLRKDTISGLVAASLHTEFNAYDNLDRKCSIFKRQLPEDSALHRFYRRVDFVENIDNFMDSHLYISDSVVDTESNVWYIVLQKNLYKIGLPIDLFEQYRYDLDAFVNRRNAISHGDAHAGVTESEYSKWETKIYAIMNAITILLYKYASRKLYLKEPPT